MKSFNLHITKKNSVISCILLSAAVMFVFSCQMSPPENSLVAQPKRGKALFQENCVECNGEDGRGILIDSVKTRSADLTKIKRTRGVREFPILEVANIIDGRKMKEIHGDRVMPVWGEVMSEGGQLTDDDIKGKMAELIAYLMTIQE